MGSLLKRVPSVHGAEPLKLVNGPVAFTPDGRAIVGEAPEVRNYYIAAGLNCKGTTAALGIAKLVVDRMTTGTTEFESWELDPRRFLDMHNNRDYIKSRIKETSRKSLQFARANLFLQHRLFKLIKFVLSFQN